MAEADRLGREAFLKTYHYRPAREYVVVEAGQEYDWKGIYGVARKIEAPQLGPLKASEFSGGEKTVAGWLTQLGFTVLRKSEATGTPPVRFTPG